MYTGLVESALPKLGLSRFQSHSAIQERRSHAMSANCKLTATKLGQSLWPSRISVIRIALWQLHEPTSSDGMHSMCQNQLSHTPSTVLTDVHTSIRLCFALSPVLSLKDCVVRSWCQERAVLHLKQLQQLAFQAKVTACLQLCTHIQSGRYQRHSFRHAHRRHTQ